MAKFTADQTVSAPTLNYSDNQFSLQVNQTASIVPRITESIFSCTSSPVLPAGLALNDSTCTISGTPTALQASAKYTITASGPSGSASTAISINVTISRDKAIQPSNWSIVQSMLQNQAALGSYGSPTIDTTTMTGLTGTGKWSGGILAPNGKIYGIPYGSANGLIIDPVLNTADTATITGLAGGSKWLGGVLAPNGKIFGIPFQSTNVLILDPSINSADISTLTGLAGTNKWNDGILAPNGKIYAIPRDATNILIIDPKSAGVWDSSILLSGYFNKN